MTMRLKTIKLAGFKSFVDPTVLPITQQLVGVVGPNGCGKSNVIDAVRWVMGGTAKNIRGGVSTDVIFSGSTARKPVGQASVELVFDNADGKLGGEYAQFSEISIKRSINRDGVSNYYLNGSKCRLKDISDIFMGTGLGPKSYAIIEQGMISRVVEAKPEELRIFVEEAAGISKYKERRRETENRIRHSRENLDRLSDLREELEKQLQRLHRQAQAAEKYKTLKSEQRQLKLTITVVNLQSIQEELQTLASKLLEHNTELEAALSDAQHLRTEAEKARIEQHDANDKTETVQKGFYDLNTEIAKNEQQLEHLQEQKQRFEALIQETRQTIESKKTQCEAYIAQLEEANEHKAQIEPEYQELVQELESIQNTLQSCEENLQQTHQELQNLQQEMLAPAKVAEGEKTTIEQLEKQIHEKGQRQERLEADLATLALNGEEDIHAIEAKAEECEASKEEAASQHEQVLEQKQSLEQNLQTLRGELRQQERSMLDAKAQLNALQKVQEHALGKDNQEQQSWLNAKGLAAKSRFAERIQVQSEWTKALEVVLSDFLQAIVIDAGELDTLAAEQSILANLAVWGAGNQLDNQGLLAKVNNAHELPEGLAQMLASISPCEQIGDALTQIKQADCQSCITQNGLWFGKGWVKGEPLHENQESCLEREQAIKQLEADVATLEQSLEQAQEHLDEQEATLAQMAEQVSHWQNQVQEKSKESLELQGEIKLKTNQYQNEMARKERLQNDIQECQLFIEQAQIEVNRSRQNLSQSLDAMEQLTAKQQQVQQALRTLEEDYQPLKSKAKSYKDRSHELSLELNNQNNLIQNAHSSHTQTEQDITQLQDKHEEYQVQFEDSGEPIYRIETLLQQQLDERVEVEKALNEARDVSAGIEQKMNKLNSTLQDTNTHIDTLKEDITNVKMRQERLTVQKEVEQKQLNEFQLTVEQAQEQLLSDLDTQEGIERLGKIDNQIQRLGAINLAAIEEFEAAQERKVYLDTQNDDLEEALQTLEEAISKIDAETRHKFKETFDKIDAGFKELFPSLFGGGEAKLILTGEDLLDTGVNIVARPPGKRNATIQQLSGGEKALTAVSLVFSIFQLNPAPFCLLDEVDAPLDDNNVGRFCNMVKKMAEKVQFIYISHNKLAIEMAEALHGVTMREAGVSRLVSVDIEKATKMAEMDAAQES